MSALKKISDLKPEAKSPVELLAFWVHVCMLNRGAKLIGLTDDAKEEKVEDCPAGWNKGQIYTFKYRDTVADSVVLVKCLPMGPMLIVSAAIEGKDVIYTLDLRVADHIDTKGKFDTKELNFKELLLKPDVSDAVVSEKISKIVVPKSVSEKAKEEKDKREAAREKAKPLRPPIQLNDPFSILGGNGDLFRGDLNPFGPGGGNLLGPRGIGQPQPAVRFDPVNPFGIPNEPNPDGYGPPGMPGIGGFSRPGRRRGGGNPFGGGGLGGGGGFGFGGGGFM